MEPLPGQVWHPDLVCSNILGRDLQLGRLSFTPAISTDDAPVHRVLASARPQQILLYDHYRR